jgi:hypothetical protein
MGLAFSNKASPSVKEGRRSLRFPFVGSNRLAVDVSLDGEERTVGHADNVSVSGIGVVLDRPLELGAGVILRMFNASSLSGCLRPAVVIRITPRDGGSYVVGCRFDHPLQIDQVVELSR